MSAPSQNVARASIDLVELIAERAAELVLERLEVAQAPESEFLTVSEAAEFLRCKPQRIYDLLSGRQLERFKDGSRVLVKRAELVAHLLPTSSQNGSRRPV
jgi:excisionase family DNA binding protein